MPEFKDNRGFKMKGFSLHQGTDKYKKATKARKKEKMIHDIGRNPAMNTPLPKKYTSDKKAKEKLGRATVEQYATGQKHVGTKRTPDKLRELADRAEKGGNKGAAKKMRDQAVRAETEKGRAADYLKKKDFKKDSPVDMNWGKVGKAALGPAGLLF